MLSTSELFDLVLGEWMEAGSLNIARQDFKMLALEGGVHAFGGLDGKKLNSVEKFNLSTGEWEITGNLTEPLLLLWYQQNNSAVMRKKQQQQLQQQHQAQRS